MITLILSSLIYAAQLAHPVKGFSIQYDPAQWEVIEKGTISSSIPSEADTDKKTQEQTLFILQQKTPTEKYHPRITLVEDTGHAKLEGTPAQKLKTYEVHALDFLKKQRFSIHSTNLKKVEGFPSEVVEIVAHQRDFGLEFVQWLFIRNDKPYLLTAASQIKSFDSFRPEAEKILGSLKFD